MYEGSISDEDVKYVEDGLHDFYKHAREKYNPETAFVAFLQFISGIYGQMKRNNKKNFQGILLSLVLSMTLEGIDLEEELKKLNEDTLKEWVT
jgi:hypothetical protein